MGTRGSEYATPPPMLPAARKLAESCISSVNTNYYEFDVLKTVEHYEFIKNLEIIPSILVCAIGLMEEQKESEKTGIDSKVPS